MEFNISNMLQQYLGGAQNHVPDKVADDFQQLANTASPEAIGSGVAEALRSEQTPPFEQMVAQLFDNGTSQQRSGMLNRLISGLSPARVASLGEGISRLFEAHPESAATIGADQSAQLSSEQVQQIAIRAQQNDPGVIDKMGDFYARHPSLVKTIGGAALAIVIRKTAERMRN